MDAWVVAISAIVVACAVIALTAVLYLFGQNPLGSYAVELVILVVCGTFALSSLLLAK